MTTGVDIVGALLLADANFTAAVPAAQIKAGALPDNIGLPAIVVRRISKVDRQPLKRGATTRHVERVSVTVRAASYRDQVAAIGLAERCCAGRTGDLDGALNVSILTAGTGPDIRGPGNTFEQTTDFRVSFETQN